MGGAYQTDRRPARLKHPARNWQAHARPAVVAPRRKERIENPAFVALGYTVCVVTNHQFLPPRGDGRTGRTMSRGIA